MPTLEILKKKPARGGNLANKPKTTRSSKRDKTKMLYMLFKKTSAESCNTQWGIPDPVEMQRQIYY